MLNCLKQAKKITMTWGKVRAEEFIEKEALFCITFAKAQLDLQETPQDKACH